MGGSVYNLAPGLTFDFFHVGALLVVIMAVITGMVLCIAITGVCCFHWMEAAEKKKQRLEDRVLNRRITQNIRPDVPSSNNVLRNESFQPPDLTEVKIVSPPVTRTIPEEEGPPPYDILFPIRLNTTTKVTELRQHT